MTTPKTISTLEDLKAENEVFKAENALLQQQVKALQEQLDHLKKQLFGKKSEKSKKNKTDDDPNPKKKDVSAHQRTYGSPDRTTKLTFPEDLPIERIYLDLNEKDKICPKTGKPLVKIGEDIVQRLAYKPGCYYIKEYIRPKYSTYKDNEKTVVSADLPDSLLPCCKADESLLANILVKKFADHIPLYRQSEILARENIFISRQTLDQWVVKAGLALKPIFNEMSKLVLASKNVFIDEVPVDMLKPGKGSTQQAYMWTAVGGQHKNPTYRVYHFRTNRQHKNAEEILKNYHGVLHSDKYAVYENLANKNQYIWCPCWVHIRRKFFEAEAGDPEFRQLMLRKIRYLFMFERIAWNRSEEERLRIRNKHEIPIIDELIKLVKDKFVNGQLMAKSKFKEALGYICSLIPYLKNYTKFAFARLDNNVAERAVRPLAIGRKNWLFVGSEKGGEAAGIILSLVQTCRSLNINPQKYLEDVMRRLQSHNCQKLEELLPDVWAKNNPGQAVSI